LHFHCAFLGGTKPTLTTVGCGSNPDSEPEIVVHHPC
jgi:hypothetical protein